jgi:uncharacterized protein (TIGR00369 family)
VIRLYRDYMSMIRRYAENGRSETELLVDQRVINGRGVLHGGALCDLLDSAIASAVRSALPEDQGAVTASLTVEFLRPVPEGAVVRAVGHLESLGQTLAFGRAEAWVGERLVGLAQGTWRVMPRHATRYRADPEDPKEVTS